MASGGGSGSLDRGLLDGGGGITLEFPKADVNDLFSAMVRGQKEFGWSLPKAVKAGSWAVVNALKTSTRESPKKRKFYADLEDQRRIQEQKKRDAATRRLGYDPTKTKDQLWVAKGKRGNKLYFRAKGKREANKHPFVVIEYHRLARNSWAWGMGSLGRSGDQSYPTSRSRGVVRRHVDVSSDLRGVDPWVKITNKLNYIVDALRGGANSVDSAMRRAADGLMHRIDKEIVRKVTGK
jgi:hypothetical protein